MKEVFYEEAALVQDPKSSERKYNVFKALSIISYVLLGVWIFIVFYFFEILSGNILLNVLFVLIPAAMFFCSGFFVGRIKNKFYVDFDYTFVSGSLRFSKVIKNVKRKFIIKFDTSAIEKLGKYGSTNYIKYEKMHGITKLILTSNYTASDGKDFYYIVANVDGDKKLLVLECTEMLIVNILKFSNKSILDEEYVKELSSKKA